MITGSSACGRRELHWSWHSHRFPPCPEDDCHHTHSSPPSCLEPGVINIAVILQLLQIQIIDHLQRMVVFISLTRRNSEIILAWKSWLDICVILHSGATLGTNHQEYGRRDWVDMFDGGLLEHGGEGVGAGVGPLVVQPRLVPGPVRDIRDTSHTGGG